ncbi:alpha/beta hydrolase, partial [Lysobacter sp. 2RAB21]
ALDGVHIELSQAGYHFLMWDDPKWLQDQVRGFIDVGAGNGG